jgi:hypothetical protein
VAKLAERVERALDSEQRVEAPPLVPVSHMQELPLSFAQQRLWFLDQLEPGKSTYNIPNAVRLNGRLDTAVLERSLGEMVQRHEVLRTTFHTREGQPVQIIGSVRGFRLPVTELSGLLPAQLEEEVRQLARQEAQRPFDLTHGPLLRTTLLRLGREEHILLLTMHHIISDGWSSGVFVHELSTLYNAFVAGQPSPLPELPIQYADFAVWQRQWLQNGVLEAQLAYWKLQLEGAAPLQFPTDRPRLAAQSHRGACQSALLPAPLIDELKRLGQREGVTLFMVLLAAFQVLLHWYTDQSDIIVGTDVANRNRAEIEGLIGFFVNQLVLRTDLSGTPTFSDLLGRVREVCVKAYTHQDLPFDMLVRILKPDRQLNRTPLFQVKLVLQSAPMQASKLSELTISPLESGNGTGTAKFDLLLNMIDTERGLNCILDYNADLFDDSSIVQLLNYFDILLRAAVMQPEAKLDAFKAILDEDDRQHQVIKQRQRKGLFHHKLKNARRKVVRATTNKE